MKFRRRAGSSGRFIRVLAAGSLVIGGLTASSGSAYADTSPPDPTMPETVTADPLPTVQHNGVAWSTVVVGNKVFVGGNFSEARPAGTAVGSGVARTNLMAFDINTGLLDTSFAPVLDGQVLSLALSPDSKTLYVGGDFQKVNGLWRVRAAAFDVATGALLAFAPVMGTTVRAIAASGSAVYLGGDFNSVNGVARRFLAAVNPTTGALLPFDPSPDASVTTLALNFSKSKVVVGGRFLNIAGQAWYGMAALDPTSGAPLPWAANAVIKNAGIKSALTSMYSTADGIYVTGYVYGAGGNLEGTARLDNETGAVIWLADCHGDHYSAFQQGDVVYTTSHSHYCGNFGGQPQTTPGVMQFSDALTNTTRGVLGREPNSSYYNFEGQPAPAQLVWYPTWLVGSATTSKQAAWSITGNSTYVVYAGEFIGLNGVAQQGLVRFAKKNVAPNKNAPNSNSYLTPVLSSTKAGEVNVAWMATHDRDNEALTYKVFRNFTSLNNTPVYVTTMRSRYWTRPEMGFVDRQLTPGSTQSYVIYVFDPAGNRVAGSAASIVVAGAASEKPYANAVLADGPTKYFPLDEATGATSMLDLASGDSAVAGTNVTRGVAGVNGKATQFSGAVQSASATQLAQLGPNSFSLEAWFQTTSTVGGAVAGFGNVKTGNSTRMDRIIYLDGAGRVTFGVYSDGVKPISSGTGFNDGAWHHVVGTVGASGVRLYVDGKLIGSRGDATSGRVDAGVWRIGGDSISSDWPNRPTNGYFTGNIDEVAVYPKELSAAQVDAHFMAAGRASNQASAPVDEYGAAVYARDPETYWRLSATSGSVAADSSRMGATGNVVGPVTWKRAGAIYGSADTAAGFDGTRSLIVSSKLIGGGPQTYSAGLWFKTTTTKGGKLIGFGNAASGLSASYDRHVYMRTDGRLVFGVFSTSAQKITTTQALNDGAWHQVVATQSADGMKLYVDGQLAVSGPPVTAQRYDGYWRVGGDSTWDASGTYFAGDLDEAMTFGRALTASEIFALYSKGVAPIPNKLPTASFTSSVSNLTAAFDGSASSDLDGTVSHYAWDFGDGTTDSTQKPTHLYAAAGTYAVSLTVTDNDGGTNTSTKQVTVTEPPNQLPTAAFQGKVTDFTVDLDASASTDPDGTIATYAWDFGDGQTGSGPVVQHVFAGAGTYVVTLVVTDNRGGSATSTNSYVVSGLNVKPTAVLSAVASGLSVDVDSAGSTDPDGSIASYQWTFGDGGTATGANPGPYTYAASGTYTVTLTVTDNRGGTDSASRAVTVSYINAQDSFTRAVATGWGSADAGGAWSACKGTCNSLFSVTGGNGRVSVAAGNGPEAYLTSTSSTDTDVTVSVSVDRTPTGGGTYLALVGRGAYREGYRGKVRLMPDGSVQISLVRAIDAVETTVATGASMPVGSYVAGDVLKLRMQAAGINSTALKFKVWKSTVAEPATWQISTTDATAALQKPGSVGAWFYTSASASNGPAIVTLDDLVAKPSS